MTNERIFDKVAKKSMSEWDIESFKKTHPSLFSTIIKSMDAAIWYSQKHSA